jgi:hypothetical protein
MSDHLDEAERHFRNAIEESRKGKRELATELAASGSLSLVKHLRSSHPPDPTSIERVEGMASEVAGLKGIVCDGCGAATELPVPRGSDGDDEAGARRMYEHAMVHHTPGVRWPWSGIVAEGVRKTWLAAYRFARAEGLEQGKAEAIRLAYEEKAAREKAERERDEARAELEAAKAASCANGGGPNLVVSIEGIARARDMNYQQGYEARKAEESGGKGEAWLWSNVKAWMMNTAWQNGWKATAEEANAEKAFDFVADLFEHGKRAGGGAKGKR